MTEILLCIDAKMKPGPLTHGTSVSRRFQLWPDVCCDYSLENSISTHASSSNLNCEVSREDAGDAYSSRVYSSKIEVTSHDMPA